jgi:hypothetical protein
VNDPKRPGATPPDLPPEYAEAYRRGYERAYREAAGADPEPPAQDRGREVEATLVDVPRVPAQPTGPERREEPGGVFDSLFSPEPEVQPEARSEGPHEAQHETDRAHPHRGEPDGRSRPGWLVPVLLAGLVVVLLLGAYGVGRVLSSSVGDADVATTPEPDGVEVGDVPSKDDGSPEQKPSEGEEGAGRYEGRVTSAAIGGASASCQAPSSVDAGGNPVRYPPRNMFDGDMSTAWRCNGNGIGQTVTLTLPSRTRIGQVGLVPGYAKTDPRNGADRYAENNRVTRVRWSFPDGTTYVQSLDGSPDNRSLQTRRIPVVAAGEVTLEVLDSVRGPRNTVAISEVKIGQVG